MTTGKPAPYAIHRDEKGRFLKGFPTNPNGNAPGTTVSLVGLLRRRLKEHPEEADAIVDALIQLGKKKNLGAIRETFDRIDGTVTQRIEATGADGAPLIPTSVFVLPNGTKLKAGELSR